MHDPNIDVECAIAAGPPLREEHLNGRPKVPKIKTSDLRGFLKSAEERGEGPVSR